MPLYPLPMRSRALLRADFDISLHFRVRGQARRIALRMSGSPRQRTPVGSLPQVATGMLVEYS